MSQRSVAIMIFNDVEVLDFAGPFEVFSVAGRHKEVSPFRVQLVAENLETIRARGDFRVQPHQTFETADMPDIVIVPGGGGRRNDGTPFGTRLEMHNSALLSFVQRVNAVSELTISVCTGALVLAQAGLLHHLSATTHHLAATTHHLAFEELRVAAPHTKVVEGVKMVDTGRIITSGGISAGIDMSLAVVAKLLGRDVALETAQHMEYDWKLE